ncbi:MAG: hypothetical protein MRZ54_12905 [Clostridiales bacterium]|nr:hypothetical protein [Clostridiales bacterium]
MNDQERLALHQSRLRERIAYAKKNSPYFAKLYQGIDSGCALSDLPTTNKSAMAKHFDEWFTDRSITRKAVECFMSDLSNVGKKLNGKYLVYTPLAQRVRTVSFYTMTRRSTFPSPSAFYAASQGKRI